MSEGGFRSDRGSAKWDRAARYLRIAMVLRAHPEGVRAAAVADQIGVSKRTIYRDIEAMSTDAELPIWQDAGRFGLEEGAFLPSLNLTLHEATTLFLAARLMAKTNDEADTVLVGTFVKLAHILPPVPREHIQATVDAFAATTPANERFTRVFRVLSEAWASRRIVTIEYDAGMYEGERHVRRTRVHPYLIEPSALNHALYLVGFDEERDARRTFKVERILSASATPETFEPGPGVGSARELARAWDVIADQPAESVVLRFRPEVARRVAETRWHTSQTLESMSDGSLIWRGQVAGRHEIRPWILSWGSDVEVLEPAALRAEVADHFRAGAARYGEDQISPGS